MDNTDLNSSVDNNPISSVHGDKLKCVWMVMAILIIGGVFYYFFYNRSVYIESPVSLLDTDDIQEGIHTVSIGDFPLEFDLPNGYGIYVQGRYEGGYDLTIHIVKIVADGYFSESIPTIRIKSRVSGYTGNPLEYVEYEPSKYVDVVFNNGSLIGIKYIELFGNKAVQTHSEADGNPIVVGYIRAGQLPESSDFFLNRELSVTIDATTYGSSKNFDQELFDLVINSLRIRSN